MHFLVVWFSGVMVGCVAVTIQTANGSVHASLPENMWPGVMIPFLMLAGGVALVMAGKYLAREERAFLIDVLRRSVEARDSEGVRG